MTKTAKEIIRHHLKRVYFNGSTDTVARQNGVIPNDTKLGETQIEVELDQALKELEAIMQGVIGQDVELREPSDHLEAAYQYLKGKNELREVQRHRLSEALYGKESD